MSEVLSTSKFVEDTVEIKPRRSRMAEIVKCLQEKLLIYILTALAGKENVFTKTIGKVIVTQDNTCKMNIKFEDVKLRHPVTSTKVA